MTFKTSAELKSYILKRSEVAIKLAQERIYQVIDRFLGQYYKEFEPEVYIRTFQLFRSLVKTDVKQVGNSWVAEVYFDLNALDYSTRIVPLNRPWSKYAKPYNTYHREKWTKENDQWVLETAMTGDESHGGWGWGDGIWDSSMKVLNKDTFNILKQELIKAGIPVK